jgi:tripartite-type tricarboxylate transporter receptor subunit TctC
MRETGLPETPPAIVKKLYEATITAMQQPSVKASLAREGTDVALSPSPEQFASFLIEDGKFWANLVKSANVKVE